MDLSDEPGHSKAQRQHLQQLSDRFEKAWETAEDPTHGPDLGSFLPPREDSLRTASLRSLIHIDMARRWQRRQPIRLEEYLEKFPELKDTPKLLPRLLFAEYCVRHEHGDKPSPSLYQQRFPEQFAELQRLIEEQTHKTLPAPPSEPATLPNDPVKPASSAGGKGLLPVEGYRLLKRIGSGSFGEVWRATAPGDVEVAVKIIFRPIDHAEAQRELQALELIKRLRHPYLVHTQAYWPLEDRLYIVMELADGSLSGRLKECQEAGMPGIPAEELLSYFHEAAEALDFLHHEHVQHRDVKPDNILLLQRHAKVADFGMARLQGGGIPMVNATTCGTPAFMAPEVWQGKISPHSDQYSLAMTYIELRLGRPPYPASDMVQMMFSHVKEQPDLAPLEDKEQQVLLKAVAKDPDQRYPSCREFVEDLSRALTKEEAGTESEPRPQPLGWRWVLVGLALLVLLVFAGYRVLFPPEGVAGSFTLDTPPSLAVATGKTAAFDIHLQRNHFHELVSLHFKDLPAGITIPDTTMGSDEETAHLEVKVGPEAPPSVGQVAVQADGGELHQQAVFELTVLYLPSGAEKHGEDIVADSKGGKYFKRIVCRLSGDNEPIEMVLVPKETKEDPDTFYIMKNKVSVGLYRKFAVAHSDSVAHKDWNPQNLSDNFPVFGVGVEDAYHFARWMHGNLPTTKEWDKAAGLYRADRGDGPYKGKWTKGSKLQIAVGGSAPMPVGEAVDDESPYGCRDMAGNGLEWTGSFFSKNSRVPLTNASGGEDVSLRGRGYEAPDPLRYEDLDESGTMRKTAALPYRETSPDLGFRVVIEP